MRFFEEDPELDTYAERYELAAGPAYHFVLSRRQVFATLGGGVVVVLLLPAASAQESGRGGRAARGPAEIGAWLHIAEDGAVTVYTGKVEVGQNARTSLTQAVVDELGAPLASVKLVMGDTALTPFDPGTFGSRTTPAMAPQLRRVAASARERLLDLGAKALGADRAALVVAEGTVAHPPSGRSVRFGELTRGQKLLDAVAADAPVLPAARWKVAGHAVPKVNGRAVVTGAHRYTSDVTRPGLLRGKVARPPKFGATPVAVDAHAAPKGTKVVHDGDFVGAVGPDEDSAARAVAAVKIEWKPPSETPASSKDLFQRLRSDAKERADENSKGDVAAALAAGPHRFTASYTAAYIAHAPLEPRAAVAEWAGDKLTVWTGTQRPFGVRRELSEALRIPEEKVRVIVPDTGAGYGGKHTGEAAVEAARLARAAGKPVKLVWTREEEFSHAYFRPAALIDLKAAAGKDGKLTAWEAHNFNGGNAGLRTPYAVAHQKHVFHPTTSPLRQGSYRALASTANHFARESAVDELAKAAGVEPLAFRQRNLEDPRLRAVLAAAAERFRWGTGRAGGGVGYGIACGFEKGGYVASCAEAHVDGSTVLVKRVVTAFECGAIVNPDGLRNQVEGAVIMGLGGALFEEVEFADGRVLNPRFAGYRVPRFNDVPVLETVLLDRKDLPSAGAGEAPIIAIAPAIANAIAAGTGKRLRGLPLTLE